MRYFIQTDEEGRITGMVCCAGDPPEHPLQYEASGEAMDGIDPQRMRFDHESGLLVMVEAIPQQDETEPASE
jgi:hypothetical protein